MGTYATPDGFTFLADGVAGSNRFEWDSAMATTTGNGGSFFGENYLEMQGTGTSDVTAEQSLVSKYIPINGSAPFRVKTLFGWAFSNTILQIKIFFYQTTRPAGVTKSKDLLGTKIYNFSTSGSALPREEYFTVDQATIEAACPSALPSSVKISVRYLAYGGSVPTDNVKIYNVQCFPLSPNGILQMPGDLSLSSGGKDEFLISGLTQTFSNYDDSSTNNGVTAWRCPQTGIYELAAGLDIEQTTGTANGVCVNILKYDGTSPVDYSVLGNWDVVCRSSPTLCDTNYAIAGRFGCNAETGAITVTVGDIYTIGYFKSQNSGTIKQASGSFFSWKHIKQVGDY